MAKQTDQVLVVDIECTCWENLPPKGQISEIIEIGLCMVDVASLERVDKRCLMVKPQRSEISNFCTELTGITDEMVKDGMLLDEAVQILEREYQSRYRLFASWGDYDRNQFQHNCRQYELNYPFGPTHLNIKNLMSVAYGLPRELGIDEALNQLGMPLEGRHHRGVDDAWNIAAIFCMLLKRFRHPGGV